MASRVTRVFPVIILAWFLVMSVYRCVSSYFRYFLRSHAQFCVGTRGQRVEQGVPCASEGASAIRAPRTSGIVWELDWSCSFQRRRIGFVESAESTCVLPRLRAGVFRGGVWAVHCFRYFSFEICALFVSLWSPRLGGQQRVQVDFQDLEVHRY